MMERRITYLYAIDEEFECQIATKKNWLILILIPLYIFAKANGIYFSAVLIFNSTYIIEILIRTFWLLLFLALLSLITIIWIWNAFGKEIVFIQGDKFSIKHDIFGLGRTRSYFLQNISNIRISEFHNIIFWFSNFIWWDMNSGVIAFDYENATYRFGIKLTEIESHELLEKLKRYFIQPSGD